MLVNSIIDLVGNTPLIRLESIEKEENLKGRLYAKVEFFNPLGSVKDRIALNIIEEAEKRGDLKEGSVIIEPTSGNTGIGIAGISAKKGYRCIIVMPETMSIERRKLIKAYGAEIVLTDGKLGMKGAIEKVDELAKEISNSFIPSQFKNPNNPETHYKTTAREIWNDLDGNIDVFISGIGTGGTVSGAGKFLKEKNKEVEIIGLEPEDSPVITKGTPGPHKIQGIGAGFIPDTLNKDILDRVMCISTEEAYKYGRLVGKKEGLLVGISSGAAISAGVKLLKEDKYKGKNVVVILPDTGERYLSTELFSQ